VAALFGTGATPVLVTISQQVREKKNLPNFAVTDRSFAQSTRADVVHRTIRDVTNDNNSERTTTAH
jgi:hypothetical protein